MALSIQGPRGEQADVQDAKRMLQLLTEDEIFKVMLEVVAPGGKPIEMQKIEQYPEIAILAKLRGNANVRIFSIEHLDVAGPFSLLANCVLTAQHAWAQAPKTTQGGARLAQLSYDSATARKPLLKLYHEVLIDQHQLKETAVHYQSCNLTDLAWEMLVAAVLLQTAMPHGDHTPDWAKIRNDLEACRLPRSGHAWPTARSKVPHTRGTSVDERGLAAIQVAWLYIHPNPAKVYTDYTSKDNEKLRKALGLELSYIPSEQYPRTAEFDAALHFGSRHTTHGGSDVLSPGSAQKRIDKSAAAKLAALPVQMPLVYIGMREDLKHHHGQVPALTSNHDLFSAAHQLYHSTAGAHYAKQRPELALLAFFSHFQEHKSPHLTNGSAVMYYGPFKTLALAIQEVNTRSSTHESESAVSAARDIAFDIYIELAAHAKFGHTQPAGLNIERKDLLGLAKSAMAHIIKLMEMMSFISKETDATLLYRLLLLMAHAQNQNIKQMWQVDQLWTYWAEQLEAPGNEYWPLLTPSVTGAIANLLNAFIRQQHKDQPNHRFHIEGGTDITLSSSAIEKALGMPPEWRKLPSPGDL